MRLYLLRHGQTRWNREGRVQGLTDVELTEEGQEQSRRVAVHLRDELLQAVYSSPLGRARFLAEQIAGPHGLSVRTKEGLLELNQGVLEGLTYQEISARHQEFIQLWWKAPARVVIPGGESLQVLQDRAWKAVEEIVGAHPEGSVAVVSHNLANRAILCRLLGMDLNSYRVIRQDEAALNIIEFAAGRTSLVTLNQTYHLNGR